MRTHIGPLVVDVYPPERDKFRSRIIMVHDLWVGGWCWHEWATRLCNLGWECWSLNLKERTGSTKPGGTPRDAVADLRAVLAEAPFPPVLLGHGMGVRIALAAAERDISAGVLVAPEITAHLDELPKAMRLLRLRYLALLMMRRPIRIRPADFRQLWLNAVPEARARQITAALTPEAPQMVRALFERSPDLEVPAVRFPALVLGGAADQVAPSRAVRDFARDLGADYLEAGERGRWLLDDHPGEDLVSHAHRWLVRTLGEGIQEPS